MQFTRLRYSAYRNLEQVEFAPAPGFNVFWGKNGQGKTNLLEGIYLLGHLKSFRTVVSGTLIGDQQELARLEGDVTNGRIEHRLQLVMNSQGKDIRLDGKRPPRVSEIAETLRQVLFSPEEVATVKGAPGLRRNLLDRAVYQLQPHYLEGMQSYYRLLKQRNQLLREQREQHEIEVWSEGLIREGAKIRAARGNFIAQLKPFFEQCYSALTQAREIPDIELRGECNTASADQQDYLRAEFSRLQEQERQRRTTLVGPHRDDPRFLINGQDARIYGSQGQQRTFILAFKIALLKLIRNLSGQTAVLMLDDITSELDADRRKALFGLIEDTAGQVFVTTTDPDLVLTHNHESCQFYEVRNGQIYAS